MKKAVISIFIFLVAVGFLLLLYVRRSTPLAESKASELVPAGTVTMLEVTDLQRSRVRWKETALYQMIHEPEVQAFLEKPESRIPGDAQVQEKISRARQLGAKEIFLAVTTITGNVPQFVAGFDYKGDQSDAEALVSDLKARLKTQYPAGKSDIVKYDSNEIETFDFNDMHIVSVFKDRWFFVSDDLDLLKSTLDRLAGKGDTKTSLRENPTYKTSLLKLPLSSDVTWFVQPQTIVERFTSLMAISNPNFDAKQLDGIKKIQAVSGGMKLDGERIRDAMYVFQPGRGADPAMARNSMAFTSPDTMAYYATVLSLSGSPRLPDPALDSTGILSALDSIRQSLKAAGLSYADFKESFGPEIGVIIDWPANSMQPSPLLALDVRDSAKAQKFVDTLLGGQAGLPAWAKQDMGDAHFYSLPQQAAGFVAVTPVVALTGKSLLFGLSLDSIQSAIQTGKAGGAGLEKSAGFQSVINKVGKPSQAFAYIDTKALFEKIYGLASNTLKMMSLFNPHVNDYADMGKLPSTQAISKHLTPIVYSQSGDDNGLLIESTGPVTFSQAGFVTGLGVGAAILPTVMKQMNGAAHPAPAPFSTPQIPVPAATP